MMEKTKPTPDLPKGLVCRTCGCRHFEVLYTRPAFGGRLLRRRACRHCGRRLTTYEQPVQ
jgi:transcriptional regulator NrdR family protein